MNFLIQNRKISSCFDAFEHFKINKGYYSEHRTVLLLQLNPLFLCDMCCILGQQTPCRITRNMEQTKMYVCTLKNVYSSRYLDALLYKLELSMHWKCCSLYTIATIEEKG